MRIGHGYDVHRFKKGRRLVLAGVTVESEYGLDGHSDADVALHALTDALLGALALGDIGTLFPDNIDSFKDIDSRLLLEKVRDMMGGYRLSNADLTIIAQKPKLRGYIKDMRKAIADTLDTDIGRISVKATTEEGLGFTGNLEGIACHAVCLLEEEVSIKDKL